MKRSSLFTRILLVVALCTVALAAPVHAAAKKSAGASPEVLQKKLDEFAHETIARLNRCALRQVAKNPDGTFTARYTEIDPQSISTSYKKPASSSAVDYIGYMYYMETEYTCTAKTKELANKGPFSPSRKERMTEIIKYARGKWTY